MFLVPMLKFFPQHRKADHRPTHLSWVCPRPTPPAARSVGVASNTRECGEMRAHILGELRAREGPARDALLRIVRRVVAVAALEHGDDAPGAAHGAHGEQLRGGPLRA